MTDPFIARLVRCALDLKEAYERVQQVLAVYGELEHQARARLDAINGTPVAPPAPQRRPVGRPRLHPARERHVAKGAVIEAILQHLGATPQTETQVIEAVAPAFWPVYGGRTPHILHVVLGTAQRTRQAHETAQGWVLGPPPGKDLSELGPFTIIELPHSMRKDQDAS